MTFTEDFLRETVQIASNIDVKAIDEIAKILAYTRENSGRLFILGVGGSAANASHAVNDFRKITGIEAYAPTDNVSELTARTNDEGWETVFETWLKGSHLDIYDTLLILSVSGGDETKKMSTNLVRAIQYAKSVSADVVGIVGSPDGYTAKQATACVVVPIVNPAHVTPHSEAWQAVVWHLLVSHPLLKRVETRFESLTETKPLSRAVFIDRDGTLTTSPTSVPNPKAVPDAVESIERLKAAGFKVIVVTNQSDIERGTLTWYDFHAGNNRMNLPVDDVFVCPHTAAQECKCRKPKPGMLLTSAFKHGIDLSQSYMIGDTWRDAGAGLAAGCKKTFIIQGTHLLDRYSVRAISLTDAVDQILEDK
jgi:D-sedoheptulose 7-phosphate isomerase